MLEVNFTPFPTIATERLLLREVTTDDAKEIFFLRSDEEVLKYLDKTPAKSVDQAFEFIKRIKNDLDNNDSILWGIALKETNIINAERTLPGRDWLCASSCTTGQRLYG
jgi:ribosomal-protein-alanine N-acetyltransferase